LATLLLAFSRRPSWEFSDRAREKDPTNRLDEVLARLNFSGNRDLLCRLSRTCSSNSSAGLRERSHADYVEPQCRRAT